MKKLNLNFKPKSYFGPKDLTEHLISEIKSKAVKSRLNQLYRENRYDEVDELLNTYDEEKMDPGLIHPMFMGGNYLDEKNSNEVEIANIVIKSTTYDVTSVYAQFKNREILYRVVDEYEGETLTGLTHIKSKEPLTLSELLKFFLGAWSLNECLDHNFYGDVINNDKAMNFFQGNSDFYPEFHLALIELVVSEFS
jgi:hypothetical protein